MMSESEKLVKPWRTETDSAIRIFDPQRGIALAFEKAPRRSWTVAFLLVRCDNLDVDGLFYLQFGLS